MPSSPQRLMRTPRPLDGGYGWIVVVASFLMQTISGGLAFSVGVYFVEFLETFKEGAGNTAWTGSINTGLLFGAGPLASILANHFGHRVVVIAGGLLAALGLFLSAFTTSIYQLYATYGVLAGFGFCLIYVPSVVIVGLFFDKRRNLAMGLAAAGFACGNFIFAPLLRVLIHLLGWRGAMIISSGLCLNCCVLGAMLCPVTLWTKEYEEKSQPPKATLSALFNISLLRDPKFVIFLLNNILWNIGSLILLVICTDYAWHRGIPKDKGAVLVSTVGFGSLIGRVLIALGASHPRCNRFLVFVVSTAISGVAISFYPVHDSFMWLVICSATYGLFFGFQLGVLAVVTSELFGVERLTSAYGYLMFGNGAGAMMGPPIAGWIYDSTQSYEVAFILGGVVTVISAIILGCIPVLAEREKKAHSLPTKLKRDETTVVMISSEKIEQHQEPQG